MNKIQISSEALSQVIVKGMQDIKAIEIAVLDLRGVRNAIADFFIICSGNSDTQVEAISDSIEKEVFLSANQNVWHKEGRENKEWVLLDFADCVCHVFKKDKREFYGLENLWGDAPIKYFE